MREMALAGPVTISRLETNIAATMHGTRAEYRPDCDGMPANKVCPLILARRDTYVIAPFPAEHRGISTVRVL